MSLRPPPGEAPGAPQRDQNHTRECGPHENVTVRDGRGAPPPPPRGHHEESLSARCALK